MIDIKVYREYWEGVQKRIPEIKKVLPVTIDEEMSKTIQGLSKGECPVLFILIPSGTGASLSADNVRENNLCVIFLMSKYCLLYTSIFRNRNMNVLFVQLLGLITYLLSLVSVLLLSIHRLSRCV